MSVNTRRSKRSSTVISTLIREDKIGLKKLRKDVRAALKANVKTEAQGKFQYFRGIRHVVKTAITKRDKNFLRLSKYFASYSCC